MSGRHISDREALSIRLLWAGMMVLFILLATMLWRIQMAHGDQYQKNLEKQSIRRIRLPGIRGRIFDRHGERMADNHPNYCIAIYLEELRQPRKSTIDTATELVQRLSELLAIEPQVDREDIQSHFRRRLPLPLVAWRGLDETIMARWAERASDIPGVDIYLETGREYPHGKCAGHLLGYVGRADPAQDGEEPYHYYVPEMEGKSGLEKHLDPILRGASGGRLVRVDVSGFRYNDLGTRKPAAGQDILLAIDLRIQKIVEQALGALPGAAVVVNPRNGDVLAMASSPGFDPNAFVPSISRNQWNALIEDPGKPLMNRAVAGAYAPGSTFKPLVAIAALESGDATPEVKYTCPGYFQLGSARFNCWYHPGHGLIDMQDALMHSCNVYFNYLGLKCGPEVICHMADALGLGRKTGIEIDFERPGLVPNPDWKRRLFNDGWRDGDTCNMSIGQGALTVTPLQMALFTAAIANGGYLYKPRLVLGTRAPDEDEFVLRRAEIANDLHWRPSNIKVVRDGMRDVVMAARGTGRKAAIPHVAMAGKTGTAEYGKKGSGKKYGWMIVFAPFDDPEYAMAVVLDESMSGGTTVAPLVQQIMRDIYDGVVPGEGAG
ncbi:MAG: penicillin-binding protein 2 [Spartobacteria bacterium]|nr:penicillin-binding protein 2 [Spartobacteria bacterium]